MFRNVIPRNEVQIICRDITGPVGTGQRFRAEKTEAAAAERNFLCRRSNVTVRCACVQYSETGHVTDCMEQSLTS
jgi:hypothetical protein